MKVINFLIVLFVLFSFTSQNYSDDEIRNQLLSHVKNVLDKRASFNYKNDILYPERILDKKFITDQVEVNLNKINEIGVRYSLPAKAMIEIKSAFLQTEPNLFKVFQFSLADTELDQIVDSATFSEYIGCCLNQNNIIYYIIFRLEVFTKIYIHTEFLSKWCFYNTYTSSQQTPEQLYESCHKNLYTTCFSVLHKSLRDPNGNCPSESDVPYVGYRERPLNMDERSMANDLVRSYSKEIFYLLIEESEKENTEEREIQAVYITGQTFKNKTNQVIAEITKFGDVEIKYYTNINSPFYDKNCLKSTINYLEKRTKCIISLPCDERKSEYLIADKNGESSCTKLKELRKQTKNIELILYTDGSMEIKDPASGGVLFNAKPTVKGKKPFSIGVSSDYELLILDSQNVAVWKSTPVMIRDMSKVF